MMRGRPILFAVCCALALSTTVAADAQQADPVALGQGDRLRLKVFGQPELSDVFEIGPGGSLVLPGLGKLTGLQDIDQARAEVGALIDRKVGLSETSFSLAIEALRPIVVGGNVARPGEVQFKPGMRVAHAIALAGGQGRRANDDISIEIQVNQERSRQAEAKGRLARALVKDQRLNAEMRGAEFTASTPEVAELIGAEEAGALVDVEKNLFASRLESRQLALRRVDASTQINSEDIAAQEAVSKSLRAQLELVRGDLARLEPLFKQGSITATRILELRRDYVEIEGQVGQAVASLAQARTRQVVLAEEGTALDLQLRLELLGEIAGVQFDILDARAAIETTTRSLEAAGSEAVGIGTGSDAAACRLSIVRESGAAAPSVISADQFTRLQPGDLLFVSRGNSKCPSL